jgi:hypothetical protein
MKRVKILFFCMIFVDIAASAQVNSLQTNTVKGYNKYVFSKTVTILPPIVAGSMIQSNFYVSNLGFFCKQELKIQSLTGIPLKLRLGSVQYCDWMEGKRHAE